MRKQKGQRQKRAAWDWGNAPRRKKKKNEKKKGYSSLQRAGMYPGRKRKANEKGRESLLKRWKNASKKKKCQKKKKTTEVFFIHGSKAPLEKKKKPTEKNGGCTRPDETMRYG